METKEQLRQPNMFFMVIAGIWLLFFSIFIIKAANEWAFFDAISGKKNHISDNLTQKIAAIQNTIEANDAVKKHEYENALQLISGDESEDYYNRWTIQMLMAYEKALQSSISWLESAQTFIAQAKDNFQIAKKLTDSSIMEDIISENQKTLNALSPVIDIKICYGIGQTIVISISEINNTIKNIKDTLYQEEEYIKKKASILGHECYQKLHNIIDTSKEQVSMLQSNMNYNRQEYLDDFSEKIENPMICIDTPYENITPSIIKGKKWLEEYQKLHQNSIDALKSDNKNSIYELCNQTKNDAQINQDIESSVQELLKKFKDNTTKEQQNRASQQAEYKDFFNEDEKKVLKEIQEINKWRIEKTLNIRGKGNYSPETYINDMFNQFYGNSWDFIDLHK